MEQTCSECGYDYRTLMTADAPAVLRREARALAEAVHTRQPIATVPAGSWSAVEYAGHVRDVLLVTRERTLNARLDNGAAVIPMGRDQPRPLSWVATHVVHELVHHRQDIEGLIYR